MKKRLMSMVLVVLIALGMVACGKESEGTLIYSIPEDFVYDQASGCYVSPDYPYVYTNINFQVLLSWDLDINQNCYYLLFVAL